MMDDLLRISDSEFRAVADLMYSRFGIRLTEQKRTLVVGRLSKRLRALGIGSIREYLDRALSDPTGAELTQLVDRITTNHSFFYRERDHFLFLERTILPELRDRLLADPRRSLRVWSAGCAAGEEPYTIAMIIAEVLGPAAASIDWGVLATDISLSVLSEAKGGVYSSNKLKELPPTWFKKYFVPLGDDEYAVCDTIKKAVLFKRLNLMNEAYPFKGLFDVVFCRNVMIYFDTPVRLALVNRFYRYIKDDGYFFIGHSESLPRDKTPFSYVMPATYRKSAGVLR